MSRTTDSRLALYRHLEDCLNARRDTVERLLRLVNGFDPQLVETRRVNEVIQRLKSIHKYNGRIMTSLVEQKEGWMKARK